MSRRRLDHDRRNAIDRGHEQRVAEREMSLSIAYDANKLQNALDRAWVKKLLEWPDLLDATRESLHRTLAYLDAHPTLGMLPAFREKYGRLELVIRLRSQGVGPDENGKPRTRRRFIPQPKPALPAWMNDPSLLPKRPPGR